MAEFTILRVNECNKIVYNVMHGPKRWLFFWAAAVAVLFWNLGSSALLSGETFWASGASQIMQDPSAAFAPAEHEQNGNGLFVLRYWFTVLPSLFTGIMNEFSCRVFSALGAVMLLGCTVSISKNLFGEKTAFLSGWLLLSTFSFALYGRMTEPVMLSGAWIMAAVAWWVHCRGRKSAWDCFVFFALCSAGTQYAGLPGWGLPCAAVLLHWLLIRQKKPDWNKACVIGACWGILLYMLPCLLEWIVLYQTRDPGGTLSADWTASALKYGRQIFTLGVDSAGWTREYLRDLLCLSMPWTPFFLLILLSLCLNWKKHRTQTVSVSWLIGLLDLTILYLLFFSDLKILLPALLAIIAAGWFEKMPDQILHGRKVMGYLLNGMTVLAAFCLAAALLMPFVYGKLLSLLFRSTGVEELTAAQMLRLGGVFYFGFPVIALLILTLWGIRRFRRTKDFFFPESWRQLDYLIPFFYGAGIFVFAVLYPIWHGSDHFQGKRIFYEQIGKMTSSDSPVMLLGDNLHAAACYLGQFGKVKLIKQTVSGEKGSQWQDLRDFLDQTGKDGAVIAASEQVFDSLPADLRERLAWQEDPDRLNTPQHGFYEETSSFSELREQQCMMKQSRQNPEDSVPQNRGKTVFIKVIPPAAGSK